MGNVFHFMALLRLGGSMYTPSFPLGFHLANVLLIHRVGWSTLAMISLVAGD